MGGDLDAGEREQDADSSPRDDGGHDPDASTSSPERPPSEERPSGEAQSPRDGGSEAEGPSTAQDAAASTQPTWLVGDWKSPCLAFEDLHYVGEMTFDATRFVSVQNFYTDSECTEHFREFIDEGAYQLGSEVVTPGYGEATKLDLLYDDIGARYTLAWSDGDELRFGDANTGSSSSEDERHIDIDPVHHMLRQ